MHSPHANGTRQKHPNQRNYPVPVTLWAPSAMAEGVPAVVVPRILVVIAGLGSLSRVPPVAMSMRLIASDASVNMSCLMYIYGTEEAVPSATLAAEVPSCRVVRSTGGMLSQLLRVPEDEINQSQAVLIMPSSVQLTADVSLSLMWRIMRANGLDVAVAACDTCKSKRLINRDFSQAVGRRLALPDLQATLFTPLMYLCLKRLANETIHLDRFAWAICFIVTPHIFIPLEETVKPTDSKWMIAHTGS